MSVNAIEIRQNEDRMLRFQYAARSYYNRAEKLNDLTWLCCIIAWLAIFLPESPTWGTFFCAIPFLADITAAILNSRMNANVHSASALRKYFDAYVLGFNMNQFTVSEVQKLEELSLKAVYRNYEKAKKQMANTGHDNPRGVRNWYEFSHPLSEKDAVYECQKINALWHKILTRIRLIHTGVLLVFCVIIAIIFAIKMKINGMVIFSSAGLIIKSAERLAANVRYYMLSLKIDGALDVLTNNRTDENIEKLQDAIDERRAMPVLERDYIHRCNARKISEFYNTINKSQNQ